MATASKKTGTSMSRIENTNIVKSIKCNCNKCFHRTKRNGVPYCTAYDLIRPNKSKCKRFFRGSRGGYKTSKNDLKEIKAYKENYKPQYPWEQS